MNGYSVTIKEASRELTAKERVRVKDTTGAIKIDKETLEHGAFRIDVDYYVVLGIHNEKASDVDYENYLIADKNGKLYVTGSTTFFLSFMNIYEEMSESGEEWELEVYRAPSRVREGKEFLTCSVV